MPMDGGPVNGDQFERAVASEPAYSNTNPATTTSVAKMAAMPEAYWRLSRVGSSKINRNPFIFLEWVMFLQICILGIGLAVIAALRLSRGY